jgi:hypothetical protein
MARRGLRAFAATALALTALVLGGCGGSDSSPGPAPPADTSLQPPGEYSYETAGFERLSAVVTSRHAYPRRSIVTIAREGCGFSERWEPRPERVTEWRFCVEGSRWRLASLVDYHEFFGQATTQRFRCRGRFVPRAPTVRIGLRWTDRCRGAGSRVTVRYQAVRERVFEIGAERVEAVLVRARARLRGRIDGLNAYDSWLSRKDGLLVQRTVRSVTAIDSPFGEVHDRERYRLDLRSTSPR